MSHPAVDAFIEEATDILGALEDQLLELEHAPEQELIDAVFRSLHTVKGSGAMFGFNALSGFTHHFETAFDLVRAGKLPVDKGLIDLSLSARDLMFRLLEAGVQAELDAFPEAAPLLQRLAEATRAGRSDDGASAPALAAPSQTPSPAFSQSPTAEPQGAAAQEAGSLVAYRIWFRPAANAFENGMRPDLLIDELAEMGTLQVSCVSGDVPTLEELDATRSYLGWRLRLVTDAPLEDIHNVFMFADDAELTVLVEAPEEAPVPSARAEEPARGAEASAPGGGAKSDSVRVQAHRLDEMMDELGELVIAQARLAQIAGRLGDPGLSTVVEEIDRLVTGLRDSTLSIRMLPIELVFGKFRRVVRNLSAELGKDVQLLTEGGETEVDKNVIDRLSEPLVHMIRNAIDHGLEPSDVRLAAGKRRRGAVRLSASQSGDEVHITVQDDGRGLNAEAIRKRAIERGVIAEDDDLTLDQIHQLIFAPGFSTAETVSSVSGRGVGMDAVRSAVEELRGVVEIATRPGRGTRVTLRLPITLAIIDGLLVRVGDGAFVIPLAAVEECVELPAEERARESGRSILTIRDELVPFLKLDERFGFPANPESEGRVVIVSAEGRRIGLVVDDILGQHQTVVKTLSVFHRDAPGLAGGTILGDGAVALIVDVPSLVKTALDAQREDAA